MNMSSCTSADSTSSTSGPPALVLETPPSQEEITKRIEEAEQLGQVGRSPKSSPTQQLAQMPAEAGPSTLGREEPAHKKLWPTMEGKAPWKEFLWAAPIKKPWKYQQGMVALCKICLFQKSMELLICKRPFSWLVHKIALEVGKYDLHFQAHAIMCLQEAAEAYLVGFLEDANLCTIHAKRMTIMPNTFSLPSTSVESTFSTKKKKKSSPPKPVSFFLLVVGCVGFCQYKGWEFSVGSLVKCYGGWCV